MIRGVGRKFGSLRFQEVAEQFVILGLGGGSALDTKVRNDGRNTATLLDDVQRLNACNSGLHDFDAGGGQIIFRAKCNKGAATVKHVANKLKGSGAHQAVRVDTKRDVVDRFSAMNGLGDHELLIFRPRKTRWHTLRRLRRQYRSGRIDQKVADQAVQRLQGWKLLSALVRGEHGFEGIGSGEHHLCEPRAVFLGYLGRQNVFQFMSKLAQLLKHTGSRVALERVHGAPNAANDFFIGWARLEFEPSFVQRLQQLIRAFEKDGAKLRVAIFGSLAQEFASTRW